MGPWSRLFRKKRGFDYLGHPQFEGFEVRQTVAKRKPAVA
jgi:hypothetical protein